MQPLASPLFDGRIRSQTSAAADFATPPRPFRLLTKHDLWPAQFYLVVTDNPSPSLGISATPPRGLACWLDIAPASTSIEKSSAVKIFLSCAPGRTRTCNDGSEDRCDIHFTTGAFTKSMFKV